MPNRIRNCKDVREMERLVDDFVTLGYNVVARGEKSVSLIKKGKHNKHGLVFLITFWFTLGLGNLIYALIPLKNEDEVMIRVFEEI